MTFGCVVFLNTSCPHTFILPGVLDRTLSVDAATVQRDQDSAPRSRGGFDESAPLRNSTNARLVQVVSSGLTNLLPGMWACVVPPLVLQHAKLLGYDARSWMRCNNVAAAPFSLAHLTSGGLASWLYLTTPSRAPRATLSSKVPPTSVAMAQLA